jgi:hypothetical protein
MTHRLTQLDEPISSKSGRSLSFGCVHPILELAMGLGGPDGGLAAVYTGSVGVGGSAIGLGVVAGSIVTGNGLPVTGFATVLWAMLAIALIFGGLILMRLAALRRAGDELGAESVSAARTAGMNAGLGLGSRDSYGSDRDEA